MDDTIIITRASRCLSIMNIHSARCAGRRRRKACSYGLEVGRSRLGGGYCVATRTACFICVVVGLMDIAHVVAGTLWWGTCSCPVNAALMKWFCDFFLHLRCCSCHTLNFVIKSWHLWVVSSVFTDIKSKMVPKCVSETSMLATLPATDHGSKYCMVTSGDYRTMVVEFSDER